MPRVGLVSADNDGLWLGGRYYLQHQIRAVASLPVDERLPICDVWWGQCPAEDHFAEVRADLDASLIIDFPTTIAGRLKRRLRRFIYGISDARDLLVKHDVQVLFPILPFANPGIPFVYWLPDFQHVHLRSELGEAIAGTFERRMTESVELAKLVVLSSEVCLRDYLRIYPKSAHKARLLRFCSSPTQEWWALNPDTITKRYQLDSPFFLLSNQFNYYKNHRVAFEAVDILKRCGKSTTLVCTGNTQGFKGDRYFLELKEFVEKRNLGSQIRILGRLPREEQICLLRAATAVLQPSRYEGWSTTIEDARTLGKRILASEIEVHREQLGNDYPFLLPIADAEAWATAMGSILESVGTEDSMLGRHQVESLIQGRQRENGQTFVRIMREAIGLTS